MPFLGRSYSPQNRVTPTITGVYITFFPPPQGGGKFHYVIFIGGKISDQTPYFCILGEIKFYIRSEGGGKFNILMVIYTPVPFWLGFQDVGVVSDLGAVSVLF